MLCTLAPRGPSEDWIADCMFWWGKVLYGKNAHRCPDWDDLPIDETCDEFECCTCTLKDYGEKQHDY